jgi:hypothetical protein
MLKLKMKTQQELIAYYEQNLQKVKSMNSVPTSCTLIADKQQSYIAYAEAQLSAVKQGGMEALIHLFSEKE